MGRARSGPARADVGGGCAEGGEHRRQLAARAPRGAPMARAISGVKSEPLPPKLKIGCSRGSRPRAARRPRVALTMPASAICRGSPHATSSASMPRGSPRRAQASRAAPASSVKSPPKNRSGSMYPSTTRASVTVASRHRGRSRPVRARRRPSVAPPGACPGRRSTRATRRRRRSTRTSTSDSAVHTPISSPRVRRTGSPPLDHRHVEGRAAHVAGDDVVDSRGAPQWPPPRRRRRPGRTRRGRAAGARASRSGDGAAAGVDEEEGHGQAEVAQGHSRAARFPRARPRRRR